MDQKSAKIISYFYFHLFFLSWDFKRFLLFYFLRKLLEFCYSIWQWLFDLLRLETGIPLLLSSLYCSYYPFTIDWSKLIAGSAGGSFCIFRCLITFDVWCFWLQQVIIKLKNLEKKRGWFFGISLNLIVKINNWFDFFSQLFFYVFSFYFFIDLHRFTWQIIPLNNTYAKNC